MLNLQYQSIFSGDSRVPLGLTLTEVNPAPGEESALVVAGLPDGVDLSAGNRDGTLWIIDSDQVADLAIVNANPGDVYDLVLESRSSLDGDTVEGGKTLLTVTMDAVLSGSNALAGDNLKTNLLLGGTGGDNLTGGALADTFLFRLADLASPGSPAQDVIANFDAATTRLDKIDLSDIATGLNDGVALDGIIDLDELAGTTTFSIDLGAGEVQSIELTGVTLDHLFGGAGWSNDADILQKMLDDEILLTG